MDLSEVFKGELQSSFDHAEKQVMDSILTSGLDPDSPRGINIVIKYYHKDGKIKIAYTCKPVNLHPVIADEGDQFLFIDGDKKLTEKNPLQSELFD